jgi:hypothetical protein
MNRVVEGRRKKAEGRGRKEEGRGQRAEGRGQRAEGRRKKGKGCCRVATDRSVLTYWATAIGGKPRLPEFPSVVVKRQ